MNVDSKDIIELLRALIRTESFSGDESRTAEILSSFIGDLGIPFRQIGNNIICHGKKKEKDLPTIVLNSHHDTVKVVDGWTRNPFGAEIDGDQLFGLGSNDAGASLVCLLGAFVSLYETDQEYNLVYIASAEEENSGSGGVSLVLPQLDQAPAVGIIGEPTGMHLAVAEKGLIVVDGVTKGVSGHAARDTGTNAIYLAMEDIQWLNSYTFPKVSEVLGPVKQTVTQIEAGYQHNVVPDKCHYVIDIRVNEHYRNEEIIDFFRKHVHADLKPRSLKWQASGIVREHPLVQQGLRLGRNTFGSPTLSDQVHFSCPTLKIGPGESERSHTADEFIRISEIKEGIQLYTQLLDGLKLQA